MTSPPGDRSSRKIIFALAVYQAAVMFLFSMHVGRFFPNVRSALGHDYSYFFPHLLDGYYWFLENGIFRIPWFTPAFCGGVPAFPNPQNLFYSVPQFLTFAAGPLNGVLMAVILFAWLGYLGAYFLLRMVFQVNRPASSLAATLFLLNGFFFSSMVIGHLAFHAFMLVPWLCFFLLAPVKDDWPKTRRRAAFVCLSILAALCWSYMFYSGMAVILIPAALSVVAVACIRIFSGGSSGSFWGRFALSGIVSLAIGAVRLVPSLAFMRHFPRNEYSMPGTDFLGGIELFFRSLFLPGTWSFSRTILKNYQWTPQLHDYDFGITPVPLIVILIGILCYVRGNPRARLQSTTALQWLHAVLLLVLLCVPFVLNLHSPWWHDTLKSLPVIGNSSTMVRWYVLYILPVLTLMALSLERIDILKKYSLPVFVTGISAALLINGLQPTGYYDLQDYSPAPIVRAYERAVIGHPGIDRIFTFTDESGRPVKAPYGNDVMILRASQMLCYEPVFGYRLERFPLKSLQPGFILTDREGVWNMKNPACYVYPAENGCLPGDHFTLQQKTDMLQFASYRAFPFRVPMEQTVAGWLSAAALVLSVLYLLGYACIAVAEKIRSAAH